jgi:hypothetical protein
LDNPPVPERVRYRVDRHFDELRAADGGTPERSGERRLRQPEQLVGLGRGGRQAVVVRA